MRNVVRLYSAVVPLLACFFTITVIAEETNIQTYLLPDLNGIQVAAPKSWESKNNASENGKMAYRYEMGDGVQRNLDTAIHYYMIAAEQGDPESQYRLARVCKLEETPDGDKEMARLCTLAAAKGQADAQLMLGKAYQEGNGVSKSPTLAIKWISAAATQGLASAMASLGSCYLYGTNVPQNIELGIKWLKQAANATNSTALCELGCLYLNGKLVPRNMDESDYCFYKAALAGHGQSFEILQEQAMLQEHDRPSDSFLIKKCRSRAIREMGNDVLAINIGDSTNKVLSVLESPLHVIGPNDASYIWRYRDGDITIKDGKVSASEIVIMSEAGKRKLAASGRLYDLYAYPFLTPEDPKYWALAAGAVLMEVNHRRHDILGGQMPTSEDARSEMLSLYCWWSVTDRESLLDALKWIETGGHRQGFDDVAKSIAELSSAQLNAATNSDRGIAIVAKYQKELGKKSILGWDYSRYICLCRWGYLTGYLTEEEAWGKIMPAAKLLQKNFDSWSDLGKNYLIGREFWSKRETAKNGDRFSKAYDKLVSSPQSPWKLCPWNMNLDGVKSKTNK